MSDLTAPVRIRAESSPADPHSMRFVLDRDVQDGALASFPDATAAQGAPLAEALFAISGVKMVDVSGAVVAVVKTFGQTRTDAEIRVAVQEVLDRQANPEIAAHGGHVRVTDVQDGVVSMLMSGGCQGCAASAATLRGGVETMIRAAVPEVRDIIDVTDHGSG